MVEFRAVLFGCRLLNILTLLTFLCAQVNLGVEVGALEEVEEVGEFHEFCVENFH